MVFYIYHQSDYSNLKCIISDVDGKKYCVRERRKLKLAADRLANTNKHMQELVHHCNEKYKNEDRINRLVSGYNPKKIYETLHNQGALYVWCIPEDTQRVKDNHKINREKRHEEYHDIDNVVDYYYQHWFGKPKRSNFLSDLSPLRERNNFIRYDMFKDGHKLNEFSDKIIERSMVLQV